MTSKLRSLRQSLLYSKYELDRYLFVHSVCGSEIRMMTSDSRFLMKLQLSCQLGLQANMKARLEVEQFPSNFTQVLVSRAPLLTIQLPQIMQSNIPRLRDSVTGIQKACSKSSHIMFITRSRKQHPPHRFCCILITTFYSVNYNPIHKFIHVSEEGPMQGHAYQEAGMVVDHRRVCLPQISSRKRCRGHNASEIPNW